MQFTRKGNVSSGNGARALGLLASDGLLWGFSLVAALLFRYEFEFDAVGFESTVVAAIILSVLGLIVGGFTHLYRDRFILGSLDELGALTLTTFVVAVLSSFALLFFGVALEIPRSSGALASIIFLLAAGLLRLGMRRVEGKVRVGSGDKKRAIIYGAGEAGELVITELLGARNAGFLPVALLDDAFEKRNRVIRGVSVRGTWADLPRVARANQADVVIVAIPSADSSLLRMVYQDCREQGLQVVVLPVLHEFLSGKTSPAYLRGISIEDLVDRDQRSLDSAAIAEFLRDKRVVVTGAGGSIGSEIVRQLASLEVAALFLLDRDETALLEVGIGFPASDVQDRIHPWLIDIRDEESVLDFFRSTPVDIVFHAAALKHVSFLEQFPSEAWKTNVRGTLNVLRGAISQNISVFVNISTDKAANPTTVLGRSKALAEQLTAWFAKQYHKPYVSVRFGNVVGSRGSLIPIFAQQIGAGGPLTVTDREATRYFMSIPEACHLVLQAAAEGEAGDVLLLDMGEPVRIQEIAERMIELSGRSIDIVYTGLRPGEKLHEDLLSHSETPIPSSHPKLMRLKADPKSPEEALAEKW